ncbi:MAG: M1 family aminopeptidase, partial [bacterium]
MKNCYPILSMFFAVCLLAGPASAQTRKWQQGVRYEIDATLDTTAKRLNGNMKILYKNNSPDTLTKIYLQVPSNAFHNEENTAVREMRRFSRNDIDFEQTRGRKLTIQSVQFLSVGRETDFPLQAYDFSDTILDLTLPYALPPGDTLSLGVAFHQDIRVRRTMDFIHWFPLLAVYDNEGWHPEPFHFMMEPSDVYSEFAEMDVAVQVPGHYVVVGSGDVVGGDPGWESVRADTSLSDSVFTAWHDSVKTALAEKAKREGFKTVRFHATKMRNFIWSASRNFVYYPVNSIVRLNVFETGKPGSWSQTFLERIDDVLAYLKEYFGPYPLTHLNIVRSANRAIAYPMLALLNDTEYFSLAYELSYLYFPGLVGTNGVKESWLAKGIVISMGKSYSEKIYGKRGYELEEAQEDMNFFERQYPLPSLDEALRNFTRLYSESGQNEPISKEIHKYHDPIGVMFNVYLKSDLFYEMLRFVVGDSVFKASLNEVVRRYAGTNIGEEDLKGVFEEQHGQKLDWFFGQWLHDTPTVDYKKGSVKKFKRGDKWVTEVEVKRQGDGIMPVDVEVDLGDGEKVIKRWDGKDQAGKIVFETTEKPRAVKVDPEDRIMDSNRLNNARPRMEFRPDWPLLKYIHMPNDAILVLWRPLLGFNQHDKLRLGLGTRSSYNAFYHNLSIDVMFAVKSKELDGEVGYSHPLTRKSLLNRYAFMLRKNEGRFEADAHLEFKGSNGILSTSGRSIKIGANFSSLLNDVYTFRKVSNDTGKVRFDEWQDVDVLLAYLEARGTQTLGRFKARGRLRAELSPVGDARFTKLSGRLALETRLFGFKARVRGNLATS